MMQNESGGMYMPNQYTAAFDETDMAFMDMALEQAAQAAREQDVPVGAVLVACPQENNKEAESQPVVVSVGRNTKERDGTVLGHAELNAIADACRILHTWRLDKCTLYVTLEPCPMCAGAIVAARIPRVVCGTRDPAAGAMGSVWTVHNHPTRTGTTQVEFGCRETACREVLRDFFRERRTETGSV